MLFSLLQVSWAINIQKNEVVLKSYSIADTSPNIRRFVQDFFFFVVDKYVRQVRPTDRLSHENLLQFL